MLERHIGFCLLLYLLLVFHAGVCGFVTCEQSWLLVPDNSVVSALRCSLTSSVPSRPRIKGSDSLPCICSIFFSPLSDQMSPRDTQFIQPDLPRSWVTFKISLLSIARILKLMATYVSRDASQQRQQTNHPFFCSLNNHAVHSQT